MFKDFVKAIQKNLQQMSKDSSRLFTVNVDTEELYNLYLDSFPAGTNEIYRERREYDCSCCRHFIRDVGKIRNHSIGTLLVNISEGMDLDLAVRKYEQIVAPVNYKRPKAIFTKKMLEDAKKTITELGYMDSLQRRFATFKLCSRR